VPTEYQQIPRELLRHGTGRHAHVILAPQPTLSPNDPLNWPTWHKDVILAITGLSAGVVGAYGPMLSPGFVLVSADLGISIDVLAQSVAWTILTIGLSLFIFNPVAKKFGRRPVYLICAVIMLSASIWGGLSTNYNSFLASRVWGGLGMAPFEVLVQCTIADMYFVHQRATRIAVWNMFLLCGISGGSLIAGYIIEVSCDLASPAPGGKPGQLTAWAGSGMALDLFLVRHLLRRIVADDLLLRARDSVQPPAARPALRGRRPPPRRHRRYRWAGRKRDQGGIAC
jgi:MFS family permease